MTSASSTSSTLSEHDVVGTWLEFWALAGCADTQRYTFFEDGRFGWHAAPPGEHAITRRFGRWTLEQNRETGPVLVLWVQAHEQESGCESGRECRFVHDPPERERLPIGQCPPNDEAKALDASYRCLSLGAHAFWRNSRTDVAQAPSTP